MNHRLLGGLFPPIKIISLLFCCCCLSGCIIESVFPKKELSDVHIYKKDKLIDLYLELALVYLYNGQEDEALRNLKKASLLAPFSLKVNRALDYYYHITKLS